MSTLTDIAPDRFALSGLRPELVGTPEQVARRIREYRDAGVTLLLIQSSPLVPELERIAEQVFPLVREPATV